MHHHSLNLLQHMYTIRRLLLLLNYSYTLSHPYILEFEHIHINYHLQCLHLHYNSLQFHLNIQIHKHLQILLYLIQLHLKDLQLTMMFHHPMHLVSMKLCYILISQHML